MRPVLSPLLRLGVAVALLALGVAIGLAAVALHALWWGLVLATAASLAVIAALPPRVWTLPPYALGWWLPLLLALLGRPEGDWVIENRPAGYLLIGLGIVVAVAAAFITTLRAPMGRGSAPGGAR